MIGYIIIGVLAAFGLLCLFGLIFLWVTPKIQGLTLFCRGYSPAQELDALLRYQKLYGFGFLKCPLFMIDSHLSQIAQAQIASKHPNIHFITKEAFAHYDATGNGNSARHNRCGDFPEL